MNGNGHALTTLAAIDALPAWQQELWAPEKQKLAKEYSLYGDTYAGHEKELGPFVELPDGTVPDFYMPRLRWKHHVAPAIDYWEAPFYDRMLATLTHFTRRIAEAIHAGDMTTAARFAGTMAHYVQDNACPGHAVDDTDLEIVKDLLPPPEPLRRKPFHSMMESSPPPFALDGYAPQCYGTTTAQAAVNFVDRLVELTLNARRAILPYFHAFYRNDAAEPAALNADICRFAARVYADYLYTVTSIGAARFDPDAVQAASFKHIASAFPCRQTAWAGGSYSQLAPGELVGVNVNDACEPVPCELWYRRGELVREVVPDALGATAHFEYEYKVPKATYRQLRLDYGIHAALGAVFPIVFEVHAGDRVLFAGEKKAGEPAGSVALDWPADADVLRLVTRVADTVNVQRVNGRPIAATGHAIWGKPVLIK